MPSHHSRTRRLLAAGLLLAAVAPASAVDTTWTAAVSGNFTDPARWTGGVPGLFDRAIFNQGGTYTVGGFAAGTTTNVGLQHSRAPSRSPSAAETLTCCHPGPTSLSASPRRRQPC